MATNKHAIIRYKVLNKCFSNRYRNYYIEDLIEECSEALSEHFGSGTTISRRQIFDDMTFMKSEAGYSAPIDSIKDGRRVYYRYSDPEFSITKRPLNPYEKEQLDNVAEIFGRVKGLAKYEWMGELETKLSDSLDENVKEIISFEQNPFLKGIDFLNPLYNYIRNKTVLKVKYQSFKMEEPVDIVLHPYYLKQYNNRWFLFGLNNEYNSLQNLPLDRIESMEIHSGEYIENTVDFEEYFEEIVGVTNPSEREEEEVVLEFQENRLPYVLSKPLHGSQRYKDGRVILKLKINKEFISVLLSYGSDLQVVAPESLKKGMIEEVEKMRNNYQCR